MNSLSDIFGKPYEGVHAYRIPIINIALVDTLATLIVAYILYKYNIGSSVINNFIILFLIGQVFHLLFGVKTEFILKLDKLIKNMTYGEQ